MRNIWLVTLLFIGTFTLAQRHEIGVAAGGANLISDIGRTNYIRPFGLINDNGETHLNYHVGLLYRFNLNSQMGLRAQVSHANFYDADSRAVEFYRLNRDYAYSQNITEAMIAFEYNFFDFNNIQRFAHSPYIFAGLGVFGYNLNEYTISNSLRLDADGNEVPLDPDAPENFDTRVTQDNNLEVDFNVLFGLGYKFKFKWNWVLGLELGFRPTSTDKLDHSFATEDQFTFLTDQRLVEDPYAIIVQQRNQQAVDQFQVGNISNSDWYVFSGITLTYTFGRPPCYCD